MSAKLPERTPRAEKIQRRETDARVTDMTTPCACPPRVVRRQNPGQTLYGYGVAVTVRVHTGACPLADEVLEASAVRVA